MDHILNYTTSIVNFQMISEKRILAYFIEQRSKRAFFLYDYRFERVWKNPDNDKDCALSQLSIGELKIPLISALTESKKAA